MNLQNELSEIARLSNKVTYLQEEFQSMTSKLNAEISQLQLETMDNRSKLNDIQSEITNFIKPKLSIQKES